MSEPSPGVQQPGLAAALPHDAATGRSLIQDLLADQQRLTAVERFAKCHVQGELPAQSKYYRDLIPLSAPRPGQQYAFEVDLDACSGCKACVVACHNLNGLDETETWRDVGLLVGGTTKLPVLQHVTSACHHCLEPACMTGCPVNAYEKDPITGIVRHLDDQCIGCQYCILKCPYDVPKYNRKKGIVRKCDMCGDRLASGEAPACVQSCPNQAIRIRVVDKRAIVEESEANVFLPGTADPEYTLPTTSYVSRRALPRNALPADYHQVAPEHAHLPLVVMLVLTQLSVGAFAVAQAMERIAGGYALPALRPLHALMALGLGLLALGASVLHLGRPLYAYRAVIGLRTSWLSREILAFGLFALVSSAYAAGVWHFDQGAQPRWLKGLGTAVAVTGMLGVFCSVMIYHDTRRAYWRWRHTAPRFFLGALLLGVSTTLLAAVARAFWLPEADLRRELSGWGIAACQGLVILTVAKLTCEALIFRHLRDRHNTPMKRTARLLAGALLHPALARCALGLTGGVLLPLLASRALGAASSHVDAAILVVAAFLMMLAGELLERYLFFTAVVAPKMPGGLGT